MNKFILRPENRERFLSFIAGLDLTKPLQFEWRQHKSSRSLAQNRLLWTWNNLIQKHLAEHYGQQASAEQWHEILVAKLCPAETHTVSLPDGARFKVGRARTSGFNVEQMTNYLEDLDRYCAENLGLLLPHPEDLWLEAIGRAA